jgi:hypothetical protein
LALKREDIHDEAAVPDGQWAHPEPDLEAGSWRDAECSALTERDAEFPARSEFLVRRRLLEAAAAVVPRESVLAGATRLEPRASDRWTKAGKELAALAYRARRVLEELPERVAGRERTV